MNINCYVLTVIGLDEEVQKMKTLEELRKEYQKYLKSVSVQGFRTTNSVRSTSPSPYRDVKLIEINPRFTGAQIVRAMAGVNGPEILVDNWLGEKKTYPICKEQIIALWVADYGYISEKDYLELKDKNKTTRKAKFTNLL